MPGWFRALLAIGCSLTLSSVSIGGQVIATPTQPPLPDVSSAKMLCDFEGAGPYGIGFEENLEPASGHAEVVDTTAHTGRHCLRIDFTLPRSGAGLYINPIAVHADQLPPDPWGLEFWCKSDAPHSIWISIRIEEISGETWTLGTVMRTDSGVTEWHPVRMAFDWAKLVTWNRVDGILELHRLRSIQIMFQALHGHGTQKGTLWVDSIRVIDASQRVKGETRGDFVLLNLVPVFNSDAIAWRSNPTDGDFDTGEWQPRTLPAEFFPKTPEATFHGIPFRMPPLADGTDNHIRCNGQKLIGFPAGSYSALYFLATGKFGDQIGNVELRYADGATSRVALDVSDWSQGAHRGDVPAITFQYTYYKHTIEARKPQIYIQSVRTDPSHKLVSIRLPENDYLKVFAITMDRGARPVRVGSLQDRSVAEVDPRYFMPKTIDMNFEGPAKAVGVLGGYLARRNSHYTLDIPTFNGFLTFASEALSLPQHTLVYDRFENRPSPFVLGGLQVEGKKLGLVQVDCLSSICATYSCNVIATTGTLPFKVYLSRAYPAALYDVDSKDPYWFDPDRGGKTHVSFIGEGGLRTVNAASGASIPIPHEPWVIIWHSDESGSRSFDVPFLLVFEKKPAELRFERSWEHWGWKLRMRYSGAPGRLVAMTLYGIRRLDIQKTDGWSEKGLPQSIVERCREWAGRLQNFPIDFHQDSQIDQATGRITLHDRFVSLHLHSDWPIVPKEFTPLPPVASLAAENGFPVALDPRSFNTGVDTFWGPLLGVNDSTTSYSIPIASYTRYMLVPSAVTHDPMAEKVTARLAHFVHNAIPKDLAKERYVSDNCGDLSSLRSLAPMRLLLGRNDHLIAYCKGVVENALKPANLKLEKEPLTGQYYLMDDRFWAKDAAYDKEWAIGFILQGLWNYAYYCNDTAFLRSHWNRICGLYRYYRIVWDWTTQSTWTMTTGNGANSDGVRIAWEGMMAMARMARAVGDEATYRDAVVRSSREMMSLYASWFGVKWAADHDYAMQQNHQIPPSQAETRFAPDITWVETFTDNASHTSDFFQVTHAFYIFNLGQILYFHDFGLDKLRLRKWIFDIVPKLHPDWCNGNVLCKASRRYYGSDQTMAHLILRALLFHENLKKLYDCFLESTNHTRVLKEWYSPIGSAPQTLTALITGDAPLVIVPVHDFQVLENSYDASAKRTHVVLEPEDSSPEPLKIRCWGMAPSGATCNGEPVTVHYNTTTDYATISVPATPGKTDVIEVQYP